MPNKTGTLTEHEGDDVSKFLADKGVDATCPSCKSKPPGQMVQTLSFLRTKELSRGIPALCVICPNCGYMRFFHADIVGVAPMEKWGQNDE